MDVFKANIEVHTKMADTYNIREPHFFPENQAKVRKVLEEIHPNPGGKLLDVGCGTGFIINLAKDLFDEIHGVDATEAMLSKVDVSCGNICLHNINAEKLPFADGNFDVVTAYAFLHHLQDYKQVLREVFRVIKDGGCFYVDLEPNRMYWEMAERYRSKKTSGARSAIVKQEIDSVCHTDSKVRKEFGIEENVFNAAEYIKSTYGGLDAEQFTKELKETGFGDVKVSYQWYAGQGKIIHEQSNKDSSIIEKYLNDVLPFSESLFKYLRFVAIK